MSERIQIPECQHPVPDENDASTLPASKGQKRPRNEAFQDDHADEIHENQENDSEEGEDDDGEEDGEEDEEEEEEDGEEDEVDDESKDWDISSEDNNHQVVNMSPKEVLNWIEARAATIPRFPKKLFNMIGLNSLSSAAELSRHFFAENRNKPSNILLPRGAMHKCYQCRKARRKVHGVYILCCPTCGNLNLKMLNEQYSQVITQHLRGIVSVISGGRTKIGYQTALRLLRAGARVIVTSRFPERARATYASEFDYSIWSSNLFVYPGGLDYNQDSESVKAELDRFTSWITNDLHLNHVDVLVNVAAQTIRGIERQTPKDGKTNRYGDSAHFPDELPNSWMLQLGSIGADEIQEVFRINAVAPLLLFQALLPLMLKSTFERRMVINTHAREGLFRGKKSPLHPHTNMAKSALHQLTLIINRTFFGPDRQRILCMGVDPGWISVDEYGYKSSPFKAAPLTEMDGATRLLHPLFQKKPPHMCKFTVKHFHSVTI